MAPHIAWLLNLDAEIELEAPERYRPSASMTARIRELAPRMTMLLRTDDVLLDIDDARVTSQHIPLTFCATPSALARIHRHGLTPPAAPSLEVLRSVNRRAFCAALGQTLPHAAYVRDMAALEAAVRAPSPTGAFVIKRDFAFAGRERRKAMGGVLDVSTRGFALRSFERGEGLQVEPWVERRGDFAQHGYLAPSGALVVGPVVRQQVDARGVWERSEEAPPDALLELERSALADSVELSGKTLAHAGYFGPFGVDAFRYADGSGGTAFQPRCEINARFTMGYPRALLDRGLALT